MRIRPQRRRLRSRSTHPQCHHHRQSFLLGRKLPNHLPRPQFRNHSHLCRRRPPVRRRLRRGRPIPPAPTGTPTTTGARPGMRMPRLWRRNLPWTGILRLRRNRSVRRGKRWIPVVPRAPTRRQQNADPRAPKSRARLPRASPRLQQLPPMIRGPAPWNRHRASGSLVLRATSARARLRQSRAIRPPLKLPRRTTNRPRRRCPRPPPFRSQLFHSLRQLHSPLLWMTGDFQRLHRSQ